MKAIALAAWIVINLAFLGMCGFFYIFGSQFWTYSGRHHASVKTSSGEHRVQYYPDGEDISDINSAMKNRKSLHSNLTKFQQFPMARDHSEEEEGTNRKSLLLTTKNLKNENKLHERVSKHKSQLMIQLRRVLHDESSVFKARGNGSNPYNVEYTGPREMYSKKSPRELVCALKTRVSVQTVQKINEPFKSLGLGSHLRAVPILDENVIYNSCAIVSSAGSLYGSESGKVIDKHDVVLRFNHAPTREFEADVGHKTTIRIVNSQVITKPIFNFLESPMYRDIKILAWDPSKYNHSMAQWYQSPDHNLFQRFFEHRLLNPETELYLLKPSTLWNLWDFIQEHMPLRIRRNPPSSGFLGLAMLLPHCAYVDMFEFIPSLRMTKRCHYYESAEDMSCTFGVWHPLSAEKLLMFAMNIANDTTVFQDGYIRIPGYSTLKC